MVVHKIIIIWVAVIAVNVRENESHIFHKKLLKDCTCFPKDSQQPRVSELAAKYGRYERRVVYLFKHQDSGIVSIYVPNQEKQDKFPDLTVGKTDKYGFPSRYNILDIFKNPVSLSPSLISPKPEKLQNKTILEPSQHKKHEKKTENESKLKNSTGQQDPIPDTNQHVSPDNGQLVELPHHVIIPGDEEHNHDGQNVQKPHYYIVPGDQEHTHDGQNVQKPHYYIVPGDQEHTHDGQNVQKPLYIIVPGDQEHTHDGQNVQKPHYHIVPADQEHIHDGQNEQKPHYHIVPADQEHTHDGQNVQKPHYHIVPGDQEHIHDGQSEQKPHYHIVPADQEHTHDGQNVQKPHYHIVPADQEHTHDGQNVQKPHYHIVPGDQEHIHDGQSEQKPHYHIVPGDQEHTDHEKGLEPNKKVHLNLTIVEEPELISSNPTKKNIEIDIAKDVLQKPSQNDDKIIGDNNSDILNILLDDKRNVKLPPPKDIQIPISPKFNKWLIEQIKIVDNDVLGLKLPNDVEVQRFKYLLINLITKSGFRLTELGDLMDANGRVLKISNLKLKRVMISDPAVYKHIMSNYKCIIPHDIPYLEAVFVGLIRPPKILGVIPLRMTLLPKCNGNRCNHNSRCNPATGKVSPIDLKQTTELNNVPAIEKNLNEPAILSSKEESRSHTEPELTLNLNPEDLEAVFGEYSDQTANEENVEEYNSIDGSDDDEEVIFPKIVGGNAATSSGTPVSSRGRSGYNDPWVYR
ncbi:uncharacterized protein LOC116774531 [Danaus plexippus]|uniref:uncharacterized protein LOC116774531 n=1 Tax=Danaus plexippus TaxID=13037 RepID=UPI002AB2F247|nr:uncharacterized protein LOC116774531 [Danaus plexippus]